MTHRFQGEYFTECDWCSEPTCYEPQWCAKSQKPATDGKAEMPPENGNGLGPNPNPFLVPLERFQLYESQDF